MAFYTDFISTRTTTPDFSLLLASLRAIEPTAGIQEKSVGNFTIKTNTPLNQLQINQIQAVIDTTPATTPELTAQSVIDNLPILEKAILLTILDQLNILRGKVGLANMTVAQAIQAVRDKAGIL